MKIRPLDEIDKKGIEHPLEVRIRPKLEVKIRPLNEIDKSEDRASS